MNWLSTYKPFKDRCNSLNGYILNENNEDQNIKKLTQRLLWAEKRRIEDELKQLAILVPF
jgi:hypothetical protein